MEQLTFLGTGHAMVTKCYNTCFTLRSEDDYFLVDAGGGNTILAQLEQAGIPLTNLRAAFISHNHTDHILGFPWIIRTIGQLMLQNKYTGNFTIYGHTHSIRALLAICKHVLQPSLLQLFHKRIQFDPIDHHVKRYPLGLALTFFNIGSTKELQFGFHAALKSGKTLTFLGDEPYREELKPFCTHVDYLLHEAFCLYAERDLFKPYEKHHATAKDACTNAQLLGAKNVILYHTEDNNLSSRQERYSAEGREVYDGTIWVPSDLDTIQIP